MICFQLSTTVITLHMANTDYAPSAPCGGGKEALMF